MHKKIIFTVVLGALLSTNVCMAKNFSDLTSSHWGYQAITKMSETGIVSGYPDGTFRPDNSITRAEFSSILVRSLVLTKKVNYEFNDIDPIHWAFDYINVAGNYLFGYENVDGSMRFEANENCVREEVARAIVIANELDNSVADYSLLEKYSDKNLMSEEMKKYIAIAIENKLMVGNADGTFNPKGSLTRAEVTALLLNISQYNPKVDFGSSSEKIEANTQQPDVSENIDNIVNETIVKVSYKEGSILLFDINGNDCNKMFEKVDVNADNMVFNGFCLEKDIKMVDIQKIAGECDKDYRFEISSLEPLCIKIIGENDVTSSMSYIMKLYF